MKETIKCPYCWIQLILSENDNYHKLENEIEFEYESSHRGASSFSIHNEVTLCTNPECKNIIFSTWISAYQNGGDFIGYHFNEIWQWNILPEYIGNTYNPKIVPQVIISDYQEACAIISKSPKASATLFRRCLQWMIRDYWKVAKSRLIDEIECIKDKVDAPVWDALETLRETWNIGAHMEKDINTIIDIDEWEVEQLKWLIEFLIESWYIKRYQDNERFEKIKKIREDKNNLKK